MRNAHLSGRGVSVPLPFSIAVALGIAALIKCGDDKIIVETAPGVIYGYVSDSVTTAPVESASIYAYDTSDAHSPATYTDSVGHYRVPIMPTDRISIFVVKAAYITQVRQHAVVSSESTRSDFFMVPADSILSH